MALHCIPEGIGRLCLYVFLRFLACVFYCYAGQLDMCSSLLSIDFPKELANGYYKYIIDLAYRWLVTYDIVRTPVRATIFGSGVLIVSPGYEVCLTCACMITRIASIIQGCNSDCVCIQCEFQRWYKNWHCSR